MQGLDFTDNKGLRYLTVDSKATQRSVSALVEVEGGLSVTWVQVPGSLGGS